MASLCEKQQCTIDRRGFRQELDSWRHKLIHCVGFESILEGLIGPELEEDLKVFKNSAPATDWSFDENCLFCCLRRDKVKEHLFGLNKERLEDTPKPLLVKDQIRIIRLEKKAEEFLKAVLCRKDVPNFSEPHIPLVAREILQRMISQFAAEYTSKTSSPQGSSSDSPPQSDQSRPAPRPLPAGTPSVSPADILSVPAQNQNPVLSKLLMADQEAPLDLTIKRPATEPHEQDGVLDLSIKKNRYSNSSSISAHSLCSSPAVSTLKCESPDFRSAKAKDLQSTSTLEQFMAKLCPHHQRRIVDAIGFLQTEVKAHASSNVQKALDSVPGIQGKSSPNAMCGSATPEKSNSELKLPIASTPKAEFLEFPHFVPNSCAQNTIPENAVSLKTSITGGPTMDVFDLGLGTDRGLTSFTANSVDGENNRQSDQPPVRMKIKTSSAAAGKRLSCVLDATLSSPSHTIEEKQGLSSRAETHSARLSSSGKRHSERSVISQGSQKEDIGHQRDKQAKVFPIQMSFPSNSVRTARKTVKMSSEHQMREDVCRETVDPDIGNCDIVFIDKPITECLKERRRSMAPRRNARKSTRGSMYSDDIWELKTVRTLAGRGNCPNLMPELTTLVTPKQILSKPEGLPPVDMPFAGACTETINQHMPSEMPDKHVISGVGDTVEVAASVVDAVEVEMSQTDQGQNKAQSCSPSPLNPLVEGQETLADTIADPESIKDLEMTKEIEESVCPSLHESTDGESQQAVSDNKENMATETQVESLESESLINESQLELSKSLATDTQVEPFKNPIMETQVEPFKKPITEVQVEPLKNPITETQVEPLKNPITETQVEPLDNPFTEMQVEPLKNPITESQIEPLRNPIAETQVEPLRNPITETQVEPLRNPITEMQVEPSKNPITETQVEPLKSLIREKAEHPLLSDKCLNSEEQNRIGTVNSDEDEVEEVDKLLEEQSQENQQEIKLRFDNVKVPEKSVSKETTEELTIKETETEPIEVNNAVEPVERKIYEAECDEPAKPVVGLPKEVSPCRRKKDTKAQVPDLLGQIEPVIVGFVNGKPVSPSDRSLRSRADRNPTLSSKTQVKYQDVPTFNILDPKPSSTAENLKTDKPSEAKSPLTLETPVTEPSSEPPTLSPPSKLPSSLKETQKQKSTPRSQIKTPLPSDPSVDHTNSMTSKRQLRSATQKTVAPISNVVTSISSPKPSTLILPPAEQLPSLLLPPFPLPVTTSCDSRHSDRSISECSEQQELSETVQVSTENTHQNKALSEDTEKNKLVSELETKQTLRSGKVVSHKNENSTQHFHTEEPNSLENPSAIKTENLTEPVLTRSKRGFRNSPDLGESALIQKKNLAPVEDRIAIEPGKDAYTPEKPTRMPLRSETGKTEMSNQSIAQSPLGDDKKLALRSQKSLNHSTSAADTAKQNYVFSPVQIIAERIPKAHLKPRSDTATPLTQNSQVPIITPKQEPPKQTVNKFFQALNGEEKQHLITNLNSRYDRMLKGWVQLDKEGQPAVKHKNKSDRQAAIWKSKRRARKPKSSEQQKYSPVQMLFMKGFSLTNICRWFLDSTETKSLVIVKKVNTRLPSETQLCFHSSSTVSGPSQGVFPSLQAERLKKHLKKFPIASPVKSNPKNQKLITKTLEQEVNTVKLKERAELPGSTQNVSKYSAAKASAQKGESQKNPGKSKNPASARILRKYSNIRGKMQGQQTTVRMKRGSKMLEKKKSKSLTATKSATKSNRNSSLKVKKSTVSVCKKMKGSAAKLARRKILAERKVTKPCVSKQAVRAQAGKAKDKSKVQLPKRCSQRLGSPKVPEDQPVETSKSKLSNRKQNEEKTECEVNKSQTKESVRSPLAESKGKETATETPEQGINVKASGSPDQVQTRSQRKMEAVTPLSGSPSNPSKRAKKASQAAASTVDEPKLTRSGALKRSRASLLPRSGAKAATKRAQELLETPPKRTRTK
ncbi:uncharacterized protein wu:fc17b08 [Cyprinodon tularosa]|uniref:uncharacterized protein wu:fc17b08 n=1 Tax=Cyprinodon tularosa TaxID=77115 RepID=UPI0018E23876|nr:uncharacterized protein wu:fc17b08 [Cyprinodon tularosa]